MEESCLEYALSWVWSPVLHQTGYSGHMTVTPALRRWRQEDQKFKVSLSYKLGLNGTLSRGEKRKKEEGRKPTEPSMVVDICNPRLRRLRQEDGKLKTNLGYIARTYLPFAPPVLEQFETIDVKLLSNRITELSLGNGPMIASGLLSELHPPPT